MSRAPGGMTVVIWALGSGLWALGSGLWALGFGLGLWALGFGLWALVGRNFSSRQLRRRRELIHNPYSHPVARSLRSRGRGLFHVATSEGHPRPRPPLLVLQAVRAGRRVRQPRHQPDGAVPQPGDARAGAVLAAHVPSLVGPDAASSRTSRRRARCWTSPPASAFVEELTRAPLRHRRHLGHHRERGQGPRDVPARARALAATRPSSSAAT